MVSAQVKSISKCIFEWVRTDEAFEILDRHVPNVDWSEGGCAPLAVALQRVLPGSELWVVERGDLPGEPEHIGVKWQGLFWDARGGRTKRSVVRYWQAEFEPGVKVQLAPITDQHREVMAAWGSCPVGLIDELTASLSGCVGGGFGDVGHIASEDVFAFVRNEGTWFDLEKSDERTAQWVTREYGDVLEERPGRQDIREAKRLVKLLKKRFGNRIKARWDYVDEWVTLMAQL